MEKSKYTIDDFEKIPKEARLVAVGVLIANELNALRKAMKQMAENK